MFTIDSTSQGQRADVFLAKQFADLSRSYIQKLFDDGVVSIGDHQAKASQLLRAGDVISLKRDPIITENSPPIDLPIIYEDQDCLVINKPTGVLTHSKGAINSEATVASSLSHKMTGLAGNRAGIVHRLDRGTSGVMIVAKNPNALSWLQKQFSTRKVIKVYIAIVDGHLKTLAATIDAPLGRHPKHPQTFRPMLNGKPARTDYRVLSSSDNYDVLELRPYTGRTHQLRVHLKAIGHPIVGDIVYGGEAADRLYLHALSLELNIPAGPKKEFIAPLPAEFAKYQ